jgi:hypothetical protein
MNWRDKKFPLTSSEDNNCVILRISFPVCGKGNEAMDQFTVTLNRNNAMDEKLIIT